MLRVIAISVILLSSLFMFSSSESVNAQAIHTLECGSIVGAEFAQKAEAHNYTLTVGAGDKFIVKAQPENEGSKIGMVIIGPTGLFLMNTGNYERPVTLPYLETPILSARGTYRIFVANAYLSKGGQLGDSDYGGIGAYTLSVACVLSDGTVVNPGDPAPPVRPQLTMVPVPMIDAQAVATIDCGDVWSAEFTRNAEVHNYALDMVAGNNAFFRVQVVPIGETLQARIAVITPLGDPLVDTGNYERPVTLPAIETPALSERGTYRIFVSNSYMDNHGRIADSDYGGIGTYTISISCLLSEDEPMINPGENLPIQQSFSGTGFPGLPAVDFSDTTLIPYNMGTPMASAITPDQTTVYGYSFDGASDDSINLNLMRLSGNLNLGIIVFFDNDQVIYQGSLITGDALDAQFTLPIDGQYTIGVFSVNLLTSSSPEATTFQIQANLQ